MKSDIIWYGKEQKRLKNPITNFHWDVGLGKKLIILDFSQQKHQRKTQGDLKSQINCIFYNLEKSVEGIIR